LQPKTLLAIPVWPLAFIIKTKLILRTQRTYKLLLLIPAIWASLFDIGITIINQPKEYWSGNLDKANEGNPIGGFLMKNHVSGLFVISFIWLIIIGLVGYYLPRKYSRICWIVLRTNHSNEP